MEPLSALPLGALRGQDEIRQLSCFCRLEPSQSGEDSKTRLPRVAASFEAIFARQMLREMRDSVLKSSLFGDGLASGIYTEMFDDYLAEAIGKAGGLGLGDLLVHQLQPDTPRLTADEAIQLYENQDIREISLAGQAEGKSDWAS